MPNDMLNPIRAPGPGGAAVRTEGGREFVMPAPQQQFQLPPQLQNRDKYKEFLRSKYGNPTEDLGKLPQFIEQQAGQDEEGLFGHVFGGQFRYADRRYIDTKAQAHWQKSLLRYRKNIEDDTKAEIEARQSQYDESLAAFDDYMKTFRPAAVKEPTVTDYAKVEKTLYEIHFDAEGNRIQPTPASMALVKKMADKVGVDLREMEFPGKEGWIWDDPSVTGLELAPQPQRRIDESVRDYMGRK